MAQPTSSSEASSPGADQPRTSETPDEHRAQDADGSTQVEPATAKGEKGKDRPASGAATRAEGTPKRHAIASESTNTLTLSGIALGVVSGASASWSFKGIGEGAHVMCRQETSGRKPISGPKWVRYGRTTTMGWLVEVAEEDLEEEVKSTRFRNSKPVARDDLMMLYPDEKYRLFWTFDVEHFEQVRAGLGTTHDLEPSGVGSIEFSFVRQTSADLRTLDVLDWAEEHKHFDAHCRAILAAHLLSPARGYVRERTSDPQGSVALLDVTPEPIRALLLVEFLQWYALKAAERSAADLTTLYRAASLIEAVRTGAPDAMMEAEVDRRYAAKASPERVMFEKYRVYAWKAAAANTQRDVFEATLPTSLPQVWRKEPNLRWQRNAEELLNASAAGPAGPAVHPGLDPIILEAPPEGQSNLRFKLLLSEELGFELVMSYFDMYALGRRLSQESIVGRGSLLGPLMKDFDREWDKTRSYDLAQLCHSILQKRARYPDTACALLQVESNVYLRASLLERYLDASALAEFSWWGALQESRSLDAEGSLWKHLTPLVKWISAAFKGTGKSLSALVQARLDAYTLGLAEAHELLEGLFRHEIASGYADPVNPQVHYLAHVDLTPTARPNFTARVELETGKVTITRDVPIPEAHQRIELQLLERFEKAPDFHHGPMQDAHAFRVAKRLRAKYSVKLVVPADLAELKQRHTLLPKGFAQCAETLNVARAAVVVAENLRTGADFGALLEPTWDLTKGVVALLDSQQAALKAMQRPLEVSSFVKKSTLTGIKIPATVVSVADGAFKIYKGGKVLFSEQGDLAYELARGRDARATIQTFKGLLQIADGAVGIVAAIPATAGLAATPVGLILGIGCGLLVASLDVALDLTQPMGDRTLAFEKQVYAAQPRELDLRGFRASTSTRAAIELLKTKI